MAPTQGLKVGIVGGSIAGCAMAAELLRLGCDVTIFERSGEELKDRGAGIVVPPGLLQDLVARGLVDASIPSLHATRTPKIALAPADRRFGRTVWMQHGNARTLTWGALFRNLRARVPDGVYRAGVEVGALRDRGGAGVDVELASGERRSFDLVVAADGYRSLGRRTLFPDSAIAYAGYVLWRGLLAEDALEDSEPLEGQSPSVGLPEGTAGFYFVPGPDGGVEPGRRQVNWAIYVREPEAQLAEVLTDTTGRVRDGSVPPGLIPAEREQSLKRLARARLPEYYAEIIERSSRIFLNAIFDGMVPAYRRGRICLAGDAGALARPHTGAGALKGMHNCMALADALKERATLDEALETWDRAETTYCNDLVALGIELGRALVLEGPDWSAMDETAMKEWWTSSIKTSQRGTIYDVGESGRK